MAGNNYVLLGIIYLYVYTYTIYVYMNNLHTYDIDISHSNVISMKHMILIDLRHRNSPTCSNSRDLFTAHLSVGAKIDKDMNTQVLGEGQVSST